MSTRAKETQVMQHSKDDPNSSGGTIMIRAAEVQLPYPPASILQQYNSVHPELGTKVVELIDKEGDHRRDCERKALESDIKIRNDTADNERYLAQNERLEIWSRLGPRLFGQVCAFLLSAGMLYIAYDLAMHGKELASSIIGAGGLIGLSWVFIHGHKETQATKKATPPRGGPRAKK